MAGEPRETAAEYQVRDTGEVVALLERLESALLDSRRP